MRILFSCEHYSESAFGSGELDLVSSRVESSMELWNLDLSYFCKNFGVDSKSISSVTLRLCFLLTKHSLNLQPYSCSYLELMGGF